MKKILTLSAFVIPLCLFAQSWRDVPVSSFMSYRYQYDIADSLVPHGEFEIYYRGTKQASGSYKNGRREGAWKQFYNDGQVMIEGFYNGDMKERKWQYFYPNGSLQAEVSFIHSTPHGSWKSYHKNGMPWAAITYKSPGKPSEAIIRDTTGTKMLHRLYKHDSINSSRVDSIFYMNGMLAVYGEYEGEVLDGSVLSYYPDGSFREELIYQEGRLMLVKETYTQNGQQMPTGNLYDGTGSRVQYNEAGKKIAVLNYKQGKLHGEQNLFYANGKVKKSFNCEFGKRTGVERSFNANGLMREAVEYDYTNNKITVTFGKSLDYGSRTIVEYDTNWVKNGVQRELDMIGNVIHETPYSFGVKNGVERYYQKTRLGVEHEISYGFGDKVEYERWFNPSGKTVYEMMYLTFRDEVQLDSSWTDNKLMDGVMFKTEIDAYFQTRDFHANRSIGELEIEQERIEALQEPVYTGAIHAIDEYLPIPVYRVDDISVDDSSIKRYEYVGRDQEEEFRTSYKASDIRHDLGLTGFISKNLKLANNLQDFQNTEVNAIFTMYIDEFGTCLNTVQHKTDAIGLSDAIQELMLHAPLSKPASMCGFPVLHRATILYAH